MAELKHILIKPDKTIHIVRTDGFVLSVKTDGRKTITKERFIK